MINESRRKLLGMLGMAPIAGGVLSMSAAGATGSDTRPGTRAATSDHTMSAMARRRIQEQHLPNIPLLTQEGKQVRFYDDLIKDKVVTINFFFAKCDEILSESHGQHGEGPEAARRPGWPGPVHVFVYAQAGRGHSGCAQALCRNVQDETGVDSFDRQAQRHGVAAAECWLYQSRSKVGSGHQPAYRERSLRQRAPDALGSVSGHGPC